MFTAVVPTVARNSSTHNSYGSMSSQALGFRGGDVNLLRYVRNNPTNLTDPSGLEPRVEAGQVTKFLPFGRPGFQITWNINLRNPKGAKQEWMLTTRKIDSIFQEGDGKCKTFSQTIRIGDFVNLKQGVALIDKSLHAYQDEKIFGKHQWGILIVSVTKQTGYAKPGKEVEPDANVTLTEKQLEDYQKDMQPDQDIMTFYYVYINQANLAACKLDWTKELPPKLVGEIEKLAQQSEVKLKGNPITLKTFSGEFVYSNRLQNGSTQPFKVNPAKKE